MRAMRRARTVRSSPGSWWRGAPPWPLRSAQAAIFWFGRFSPRRPPTASKCRAPPPESLPTIIDVINAGARVINLSVALQGPSPGGGGNLQEALDFALRRGVIVVAAAGNQGTVGGSVITRYPWVIPVVAYDLRGRPMGISNLGASIGRCGLGAPGEAVTSLGITDPLTMGGTSAATPFVTGAVALTWSEFPGASTAQVRSAVTQAAAPRRTAIVPPLLNAWASYQAMSKARS